MSDDARYQAARARAHDMRLFYSNLASFAVINVVLFIIDVATGGGWWFYWVTIFWGIGLLFHAWQVFGPGRRLGDDWEERKTQEILSREDRQ